MSEPTPRTASLPCDYLCESRDGTFVYCTWDAFDITLKTFRLQTGDGLVMVQVPLKYVVLSPKNNAIVVNTLDGAYIRLPLMTGYLNRGPVRWLSKLVYRLGSDIPVRNREMLYRLNPKDYTIYRHADGTVSIS